ncbi:unnamed protein product [Ectocarpus sp. 12 AP-2014]
MVMGWWGGAGLEPALYTAFGGERRNGKKRPFSGEPVRSSWHGRAKASRPAGRGHHQSDQTSYGCTSVLNNRQGSTRSCEVEWAEVLATSIGRHAHAGDSRYCRAQQLEQTMEGSLQAGTKCVQSLARLQASGVFEHQLEIV